MRATLMVLAAWIAIGLAGCGADTSDFPNSPNGSFIQTGLGPGPVAPVGPVSGHTTDNPTGAR